MGRVALTLAIALAPTVTALVSAPVVAGPKDPFETLSVQRQTPPGPPPDVVFRTLDGREARLGDLRGKVVLLGFFTTT